MGVNSLTTIGLLFAYGVGAAQCLGELYRYFGRRIVSGLLETSNIVGKLLKFIEVFKFLINHVGTQFSLPWHIILLFAVNYPVLSRMLYDWSHENDI